MFVSACILVLRTSSGVTMRAAGDVSALRAYQSSAHIMIIQINSPKIDAADEARRRVERLACGCRSFASEASSASNSSSSDINERISNMQPRQLGPLGISLGVGEVT